MTEKNLINDELFAEELPEQVDLTEAAGCFGTFGCLGSIGGCFGCFGTYGCGGAEAEVPTDAAA